MTGPDIEAKHAGCLLLLFALLILIPAFVVDRAEPLYGVTLIFPVCFGAAALFCFFCQWLRG